MKLLITGSRTWNDVGAIKAAILDAKPDIIVHGGAPGADTLAGFIAKTHQIDYRVYPAKWKLHGKAAGPIRNRHMLKSEHRSDEPIDLCLAFPVRGSIGTLDMMKCCEQAGIKVVVDTRKL